MYKPLLTSNLSSFSSRKLIRILIPVVFLFLVPHSVFAQHENISFEHFTSENGLSAPVTSIIQDHYGFLWLATTDGLNRFDGRNFIVYHNIPGDSTSLANNIINAMCVDSAGHIWAATNGGLCYYTFSDDAFHHITFNDTLEKIDRHRVHAITNAMDNGIWFATKTILHKWYKNKVAETIPLPLSEGLIIRYLYADQNHQVWIGTSEGLFAYNELTKNLIHKTIGSPFSIEKKLTVTIHPILQFDKDTLLIGSWYGDVQKVFLYGDSIYSTPLIDQVETDQRKHITTGVSRSLSGRWWVGTYGSGLALYDSKSGNFIDHFHHNPADAKSLSDDYINDVFTDESDILWLGTAKGLDKFDPLTQQFKSVAIPVPAGEFSVYRSPSFITEDHNDPDWLWMTVSGAGLFHYRISSREFKLYNHDDQNSNSLKSNTVYVYYRDHKDRVWIGMREGLNLFDERSGNFSIPKFPGDIMPPGVNEIIQDKDHGFWFATQSSGVYYYNEDSGEIRNFAYDASNPNSLPDDKVFCILMDHNDHIWIGTQNRGLCSLNPATGKFTFFQHNKKDTGTIPDNGIYDLYEDENHHMWIATENGLAEMDLATSDIKIYTTKDGLCNNDIFSITRDRTGNLWFATNNGVSKFDPSTHLFKSYFIHDGLPANSISGAAFCNSNGTLFLGSSGMLTFCQPETMKINRRIPTVVITNFKIFDQQAAVMRNGDMLQPVRLSYKENMITFDFAALNFTNSILNQYAYQLVGFNGDWIYCGNKQSATFTNLDGGTYIFRVKAANNDGVWNEVGTQVLLIVNPPYWKTWWFYVICVLVVASILYALYRFRINQLMRLQQIRSRISRDLHDDIGSTLSSINMISSMADKSVTTGKKSSELFQTISHASSQALELMNDIVWSINPKNDKMEMIIIRMRQYASEILEAAQIPFTIEMNEETKGIILPIEKRKDFYLIFKEAINNLAKYSNASQATIRLKYVGRILSLIISDNGKGFNVDQKYQGNGLKNMKARAESLKGDLYIFTGPGEGTIVTLNIPVTP